MNLNNILTKFGQEIGVGPIQFDDRNACYLRFNQDTIVIEHIDQANSLFIYSVIHDFSHIQADELYELLLSANLFGQGSGSGAFARNAQTSEILLVTRLESEELSYEKFVLVLENYLLSLQQSRDFIGNETKKTKSNPLEQNFHLKNPFA